MPFSATIGSTLLFTANFVDANAVIVVPSSATLTVTYPPSSNSLTTVSCAIGMTPSGSFFIATWASGVAALGLSSFSVSAAGQATPITGTLRLHS